VCFFNAKSIDQEYFLYLPANFYPEPSVLIPASALLGIGGSVLWGTATYYLMQLAQRHAEEKKKNIVEVTSDFFGKLRNQQSVTSRQHIGHDYSFRNPRCAHERTN